MKSQVSRTDVSTGCITHKRIKSQVSRTDVSTGYITHKRIKSHMSLEQMYLQIHHTGTVTGSGCRLPCAGGHKTSRPDGPSHRRRSPRKAVAVAASLLECARSVEREVAHSLGFGVGAEALEPPPPKSLAKGSGLGSASGGVSTSIGSSSRRSSGAEGTTPPRALSPPPVVVTDTICIPGASAAAPEFPPPPRRLADPLRHLPLHL